MTDCFVRVALDHPLQTLFDYRYRMDFPPVPGMLVQVPFGRRLAVGLICEVTTDSDVPAARLKDVEAICAELPPLLSHWLDLVAFAADYYQRGRGEVALPAMPQALRDAGRWGRLLAPEVRYRLLPAGREALPEVLPARAGALRRLAQALGEAASLSLAEVRALHPKAVATLDEWQAHGWVACDEIAVGAAQYGGAPAAVDTQDATPPQLTDQQAEALDAITAAQGFAPFLLHGVTGSGKTEVYLRALAACCPRGPMPGARAGARDQPDAAVRRRSARASRPACGRYRHAPQRPRRGRARPPLVAAHTGAHASCLARGSAVLASLPALA